MRTQAQMEAFSLVEVTLALGIAAISLLVIFSLLPIGLQTNQRSIEQTAAVDILSAVVADLRATQRGIGASPQFNVPIPANPVLAATPAPVLYFNKVGQASSALQPDSRYQVTITFLADSPSPAGSPARTATLANLRISWPAAANATNAQGSAEIFAAFDRN
jgi:uncharacterized protein (TIGR02598 family)